MPGVEEVQRTRKTNDAIEVGRDGILALCPAGTRQAREGARAHVQGSACAPLEGAGKRCTGAQHRCEVDQAHLGNPASSVPSGARQLQENRRSSEFRTLPEPGGAASSQCTHAKHHGHYPRQEDKSKIRQNGIQG